MSEIIYILTNEAMPGYVKIGRTSANLEQRIRELSASTSIPIPFTCFYACTVKDAQFVEHQLHDAFDNNRINPKREFFQIAPERVVSALKLAEIENITAKVVENHSVEYNGKITSLSNSAQKILGYDYGVAGTDYWMYEGETLDERRRRFESGIEYSDKEIEAAGDQWLNPQSDIKRGK